MKFIYKDLGSLKAGAVVEVTVSAVANVRLMDTPNFNNYKNGMKQIYTGGTVRQSPVQLMVPTAGHWHVAIDINGIEGSNGLKAGVKVLPG
jgi:hypothetical protein